MCTVPVCTAVRNSNLERCLLYTEHNSRKYSLNPKHVCLCMFVGLLIQFVCFLCLCCETEIVSAHVCLCVCVSVYLGEVVMYVERSQLGEVSVEAQGHKEACILISQLRALWLVVGYPG